MYIYTRMSVRLKVLQALSCIFGSNSEASIRFSVEKRVSIFQSPIMSFEFDEVCQYWYNVQIQEQLSHHTLYNTEKPTLKAFKNFDPESDANVLRAAMKGIGTTEEDIIEILTKRDADQRMKIQEKFKQLHGRDLAKDLKSELSGVFERVILSLLKPLPLFYAEQIKEATKGAGTDETALIEIFCTRDNEFIKCVKETFEAKFDTSLEKIICKETSGNFEKLLMSILSFCRDDSASSPSAVADELCAEDIDEDGIRRIVTSYTLPFLKEVFAEYCDKSGEEFTELVEKKCSGDSKKAYKAIYQSAKSRTEFFAHALHEAMKGYGTDDSALIRIIIGRCEIDLETIKEKYTKLYESDLVEEVKKEVSGDYERTMLNLLGSYE